MNTQQAEHLRNARKRAACDALSVRASLNEVSNSRPSFKHYKLKAVRINLLGRPWNIVPHGTCPARDASCTGRVSFGMRPVQDASHGTRLVQDAFRMGRVPYSTGCVRDVRDASRTRRVSHETRLVRDASFTRRDSQGVRGGQAAPPRWSLN